MSKTQKPTVEQVIEKANDYKTNQIYTELMSQHNIDDDYYEGKDPLGIDSPYKEVRNGMARSVVDVAVQRIFTDNPEDITESSKATAGEEKANTQIKLWVNAWLNSIMQECPNAIDTDKTKGLVLGECYLEWIINPLYEDENIKNEDLVGIPPVLWYAPDPRVVYASPVMDRGIPREYFKIYNRTVEDVLNSWPKWSNPLKKKFNAEVDWVEWRDKDWRCYLADKEPVLIDGEGGKGVGRNRYGSVNLVHIYSGFGQTSYEGKLATLARSIYFPIRGALTELQRMESFADNILRLFCHSNITVTGESETEARKIARLIDASPGGVFLQWGNNKIEKVKGQDPPQGLFSYIAHLQQVIEMRSFVSLLSGHNPTGATSGVQQASQIEWALPAYQPFINNLSAGVSRAVSQSLKVIYDHIEQPTVMGGITTEGAKKVFKQMTLTKDILEGRLQRNIVFKTSDPTKDIARAQLGANLYKSGGISLYRFKGEYLNETDPEKDTIKMAVENFLKANPLLNNMLQQHIAYQWGLEQQLEQLKAEAETLKKTPAPYEVLGENAGQPQDMAVQTVTNLNNRPGIQNTPMQQGAMANVGQ